MTVTFHNGMIADSPEQVTDQVRVSVPNLTTMDRLTYGPMSFRPQISADGGVRLPQRGDKALVGIDDAGPPWLLEWERADATVLTPHTLTALDLRVDVVEQAIGAFQANPSAAIGPTGAGTTGLVFDSKVYDVSNWYSTATGRYTPQLAGLYLIGAFYHMSTQLETGRFLAGISHNGSTHFGNSNHGAADLNSDDNRVEIVRPFWLNGTTDFVQAAYNHNSPTSETIGTSSRFWGLFMGTL